jgi:hypothetical protein
MGIHIPSPAVSALILNAMNRMIMKRFIQCALWVKIEKRVETGDSRTRDEPCLVSNIGAEDGTGNLKIKGSKI